MSSVSPRTLTTTTVAMSSASCNDCPSALRLIVVDDQALVRGSLATLLSLQEDFEIVGEAASGREAIDLANRLQGGIDVAIMDVEMPQLDGIAATRELKHLWPSIKVLMVTTFGRPGYVQRALAAGACGFIVKDSPVGGLADSIRRTAAGEQIIDPTLAVQTLKLGTCPWTARETEVLRAAANGQPLAEVAAAVCLSAGTVRNHISSAMSKVDAHTRAEAIKIGQENGWI